MYIFSLSSAFGITQLVESGPSGSREDVYFFNTISP